MNVTKIIQEELGQMLEKDGFQSDFKKNIWTYEREKNGVRQEITILTDRYNKKYLKVLFGTNAYGQGMKEFCNFVPEAGAKRWEFWGYKNENELRTILKEFKRLIVTYGMDLLKRLANRR